MNGKSPREHVIFWFRRDLRLEDNHGLFQALNSGLPVVALFIFDRAILERLDAEDARLGFILQRVGELRSEWIARGGGLRIEIGKPEEVWTSVFQEGGVRAVYCNEDYEPYALKRDLRVAAVAKKFGVAFNSFKDQVLFARDEVSKDDGKPYRVFTPYARRWKARLKEVDLKSFPSERSKGQFLNVRSTVLPTLKELGFTKSPIALPGSRLDKEKVRHYHATRDRLGLAGTSRLGLHLRFGTISVRNLIRQAKELNETFLNELIWREFFMQILYHYPHTVNEPFDPRYAQIAWINSKSAFQKWCEGQTGYPLVDAGMRELNATGFMHNRARMVTASFLAKHLLIDWTWGERYFAKKLLDFELSSNVGNWQWAAGCGCDAAPYFRVFNPTLQQKKFDKGDVYVKRWVPEFGTVHYAPPMVDHAMARRRAIATYRQALKPNGDTK